jgi:hypothetical protein
LIDQGNSQIENGFRYEPFRWPAFFVFAAAFVFFMPGCRAQTGYAEIPVSDRRMNLKGLEAVSTQYLNAHPKEFYAFSRILTEANDALGEHERITRGEVMRWLRNRIKQEGYDEGMPVYRLLKSVYLQGWEGSDLTLVDDDDREYLYDLISAVMGGMHLCTTCSTAHPM